MEIDFTRLKYFLAVADELHFKRAAERLHITPPPLSKQIKLLERELGGALFERDYHEVRLTPLGEALVEPVRRILEQVAELKVTADTVIKQVAPLRVGATAYAPSDLVNAFEDAVAGLTSTPTVFSIPGSAAEVAAHLVAGHLDLGLIHLPPTDERIDYRVIARYRSGIAVRSDDPLAEKDLIVLDDLRDREVAVDFAGANPFILAQLTRRLTARGITKLVQASPTGRGSEIEVAAQVRSRHLVVLISYAPTSFLGRVFSPPEFTLIPIDEDSWEPGELAIAWARERRRQHVALEPAIEELAAAFHTP
ncbi:DNA-binding transcriptional LysR family regulator [Amycolatopsis bartoniae]|uniref:Transcriptional regulator n=1 Tax=Amycolatopsis bartoniae TaxID=941986 RepID=A0A8H9M8S6_9PSEU|nr:LysR family transcriptional regulator [Amycolatopsis bartoniae]MBB2939706.1 DNA-binding transcriptional LysR family regulator [Amycolatopsis bartoniae]TVT06175.1 LysR family transcriptional regulator [Amycolatopsis bartoniae]GHF36368.1 transcriptional regulator [Amycolatopsis bartoniae]